MENDRKLDDKLARLTDAVLTDQPVSQEDDEEGLADVVRGLSRVAGKAPAPPALDAKIRAALMPELEARRRPASVRRFPITAVAAAAAFVLVAVVVLSSVVQGTPINLSGTAVGAGEAAGEPVTLVFALVVLGVVGAGLIWLVRRRR
jgi:hypothetical protein